MAAISRRNFNRLMLGATASVVAPELLQPKEKLLERFAPLTRQELSLLPPVSRPAIPVSATPARPFPSAAAAPTPRPSPSPPRTTPPPPPQGSLFRRRSGGGVTPLRSPVEPQSGQAQPANQVDDDRPASRAYTPARGMTPELENRVWACFQRVICYAEGTWSRSVAISGYLILFTGKLATDIIPDFASHYRDHPFNLLSEAEGDRVMPCGIIRDRRVCSTAFGVGQAITTTWNLRQEQYPNAFFKTVGKAHPINQDRFMLINAAVCGAYWTLMRGTAVAGGKAIVNQDNLKMAIAKASVEWAGLPGLNGESTLEQNAKPMSVLVDLFNDELAREQGSRQNA